MHTPGYQPTGSETVTFVTSRGTVTANLFGEHAPVHVGNFVELAESGFYDGTKIHRYEPGFVAQGGDPLTKDASVDDVCSGRGRFGTGGPGYSIVGEFDPAKNPNRHVKGALGMARSASPDSAGSQFYFTLEPSHFLDGQYTVFGQVTDGLDAMSALRVGDVIESVTITR